MEQRQLSKLYTADRMGLLYKCGNGIIEHEYQKHWWIWQTACATKGQMSNNKCNHKYVCMIALRKIVRWLLKFLFKNALPASLAHL